MSLNLLGFLVLLDTEYGHSFQPRIPYDCYILLLKTIMLSKGGGRRGKKTKPSFKILLICKNMHHNTHKVSNMVSKLSEIIQRNTCNLKITITYHNTHKVSSSSHRIFKANNYLKISYHIHSKYLRSEGMTCICMYK